MKKEIYTNFLKAIQYDLSVTKSNWQLRTLAMRNLSETDDFVFSTFHNFVTCTVIKMFFSRTASCRLWLNTLVNFYTLKPLTLDAIWYNWIRIWQSKLKPIGAHWSLFCTQLLVFPFLTHRTFTVPSVVEFDALQLMPIQCLEGLNPVTHTWPNFSLPLYSCCNIKKNGLFNSNCSAETLSTRTSTAITKLVLTPSPRTSLFCNCHESSPNKVGIFLLCLIKSMQ